MALAAVTESLPTEFRSIELHANGLRFTAFQGGSGPLVLVLHGFPDDARSMLPLAQRLIAAGFRCVVPYLRGYRPTEAPPNGDYSVLALARDAVGLIDAAGDGSATIVGHDWGAVTAHVAANLAPERVRRIVAMSVPPPRIFFPAFLRYPAQVRRSWYMGSFQLPGAAARLAADNFALVERLWREWSPGWDFPATRLAGVKATLGDEEGASRAIGYYRSIPRSLMMPHRRLLDVYRVAFSRIAVPALVLSGDRDGCIGCETHSGIESAYTAPLRFEVVRGVGHFLPLEATDAVAELAIPFLRGGFE
ncbi:alpha/beta fold hydrolase [Bradyrhizobium elkanii]|uniref:alpha/beta fold hydrolase n=1 Tax=Bradyrhizobium elkanii TaxID=29448 RepID=UPI0020A1C84B|nr:alpha/beta hydrolase [Bradyrhizobium elkanii]MCP1968474.1 pimeloyl-ACP methyl ester carboxylesterase [Bradyrhizobium elkanii]MCS4110026.1 pimeloyl-ACP methyl ester carboxylesterase [Bradyrhizobium elkanii]